MPAHTWQSNVRTGTVSSSAWLTTHALALQVPLLCPLMGAPLADRVVSVMMLNTLIVLITVTLSQHLDRTDHCTVLAVSVLLPTCKAAVEALNHIATLHFTFTFIFSSTCVVCMGASRMLAYGLAYVSLQ